MATVATVAAAAALLLVAQTAGVRAQQIQLTDRSILSALFDRPGEPLVNAIGNIRFNVPPNFLPTTYRNVTLENRFGTSPQVTIPNNTKIPDLSLPIQLRRNEPFSLFIPMHRKMAARLIDVLVGLKKYEDFVTTVVYCRSLLNPLLVSYAYSVAILHRNDTRNQALPNFACINPGRFLSARGIAKELQERTNAPITDEQRVRMPIEIPMDFTGTDLDVEHRVAYFREDVGINLHHWNWHLVYPFEGPREVVDKDRRGELFFYMHQQIIARYNFERLSNKLKLVQRFINWREPIPEAYFPKLDSMLASRVWPPRQAFALIRDIARPVEQTYIDLQDMERWRERIFQAIHDGRVQNVNGSFVPLSERNGIDILGNILEASDLSINPNLYGNLHNVGHLLLGFIHDPDHRHLESFGVIGDSATAMRDPIFYRWHAFIDDLFQEHKNTLPRYTDRHLGYPGITIKSAELLTNGKQPNILNTFWQKSDLELSRGLDFLPQAQIFVRITHLQYTPFVYRIRVQNSGKERMGTVRIFMAPHFDDRGLPMRLRQQRGLFIELDRFLVLLKSGDHTFIRNSTQSSVTIPYERTFRNQDRNQATSEDTNYCGCGWPQHMLLPKGTPDGLQADLFVMVSNYADDQVNQRSTNMCRDASSYCGVRGEKYPDRRAMGFPFDRPPTEGVETLESFKQLGNGNMFSRRVAIFHTG
ncbi:Phenoloxidase 1 [Gryllus bimaculatus]|nr:Phenoloxidase 1 [Gryllus bimaculatus]